MIVLCTYVYLGGLQPEYAAFTMIIRMDNHFPERIRGISEDDFMYLYF